MITPSVFDIMLPEMFAVLADFVHVVVSFFFDLGVNTYYKVLIPKSQELFLML